MPASTADLETVIRFEETTFPSWSPEYQGLKTAAAQASARILAAELTARVVAAYLRVTGGQRNQYVRLAALRALLPGENAEAVNEALCAIQQAGEAVLYPIDDPQRLTAEDHAAALRVCGERRDLFCLKP